MPKTSVNMGENDEELGMAEGLLGGVLGEQEEKPEGEAAEAAAGAATGAEAFAAAVAAIASRQDPAVARDTSAFSTLPVYHC
jgi:hypothetical protein